MPTTWVLIDETNGAKTADGSSLDPATLQRIASACDAQMNGEFANHYGGQYQVRAGRDKDDVRPGEQVYLFVAILEQAPGASAFHDTDGNGIPVAYCAVTTCATLLGPTGVSVDASHEILEAGADPSCNIMADNLRGLLVAYEVGDPVEVQTYASHVDDGVQVSNFVLPSWFDPKAPGPYDFMTEAGIEGAVAPPGPLQIAPGDGGNYVITETSSEDTSDTFGIHGTQRKDRQDTSSRFMRRMMQRQVSHKGKMRMPEPLAGNIEVNGERVVQVGMTPGGAPILAPVRNAERVARPTPTSTPSVRQQARVVPVSLQRAAELAAKNKPRDDAPPVQPREISEAAKQAANRYMNRVEQRAGRKTPKGQIDQQTLVLAGRKRLRGGQPKAR
jgi:hypothetical protein